MTTTAPSTKEGANNSARCSTRPVSRSAASSCVSAGATMRTKAPACSSKSVLRAATAPPPTTTARRSRMFRKIGRKSISALPRRGRGDADAGLQSAFAHLGAFPPPTTCTAVLTRFDGTGAGRATDAREVAIVEWVIGKLQGVDVLLYFVQRPVEQGTHLVQAIAVVPFDRLALRPEH